MKNYLLIIGLLLILPFYLSAQSSQAAQLEQISKVQTVTCSQAAWVVISSAGNSVTANAAFNQAVANGWIKNVQAEDSVTLGDFSNLVMQAFGIKGGLLYRLFPTKRYAYRSMVSRAYIQGVSDPHNTVTGEEFLHILGKVLSEEGGE